MDTFVIIRLLVIIIEVQFILIMVLNRSYFLRLISNVTADFAYICILALQLISIKQMVSHSVSKNFDSSKVLI